MSGLFIVIEGPEASGKSTQILKLKEYLEEKYEVVMTREPGGTAISEKIRNIILDNANTEMESETEALLYAAARAQHYLEKIKPEIAKGKIVICDRFVHSSLVYQGIGRGLGIERVKEINDFGINNNLPDLILYFDVDYDIAMSRLEQRGHKDRLENESANFHKKIFKGYSEVLDKYSEHVIRIDANKDIDSVFEETKEKLRVYLEKLG